MPRTIPVPLARATALLLRILRVYSSPLRFRLTLTGLLNRRRRRELDEVRPAHLRVFVLDRLQKLQTDHQAEVGVVVDLGLEPNAAVRAAAPIPQKQQGEAVEAAKTAAKTI